MITGGDVTASGQTGSKDFTVNLLSSISGYPAGGWHYVFMDSQGQNEFGASRGFTPVQLASLNYDSSRKCLSGGNRPDAGATNLCPGATWATPTPPAVTPSVPATAMPTRVPIAPSTGTPVAPPIPVTPPAVTPATAAPTRTPVAPATAAPTRSPTRLPSLGTSSRHYRRDQPRWVRDDHDHDGFERCHRLHCHSGQGGDGHQNERRNDDVDQDHDHDLVPSRPLTSVENTTHKQHLSSRRMGRHRGLFDQRCLHQDAPP
jgi:hypothetical protein